MDSITLNWAGGEHEFALRIGELRALQQNCDAGPEEVLNRIRLGTWKIDDLIEPIRLGLVGSGAMNGPEAGKFVTGLFDKHPKAEFKLTALAILAASLLGVEDDQPGEAEGADGPLENGSSAPSTATVQ